MTQHQTKRKAEFATALQNLLRIFPIEKITIDQICKEAGIHRSTFYRYFQDKYDLLEYAFDQFLIANIDQNHVIESLITLIAEDKVLFRNVSINNNNFSLYEIMVNMVANHLLERSRLGHLHDICWVESMINNSNHPELASTMVAGAVLTLLLKWINSNYQMDVVTLSEFVRTLPVN